ncbi:MULTISPECIES: pyridoxamine 5'-phosphate oxidase family protein [Hymenobacter]|uniref:Pyridoxamine 5'-phosphate oxidase family protein n=2 Tax=Hymenobacter TaxID=89966 RepID=A0ABS6X2X9_9BACT|nr:MULTISPECIES: pyridoxamine 5'-phosphate oxidase family protein [Hymenobacter]MBO3269816.1 pyridoxamine 5'-phosphate oxidase family protein [Hymenobacter defluvii]MBW3130191.1 pyridoxamine 5'-phosphate oxidase family protein [Hymenobacter profundi]QNE39463.1 pyridoxamine 5'-phosphate oxidase family protein [Hymenobacter sp. NBH84]
MSHETHVLHDVQKLFDKIKDVKIAMLTTTAEDDQSLRSRPMGTLKPGDDGSLYFFTDKDDAKVYEVKKDSHVNLSYADPSSDVYVSVSGRANAYRDQAKIDELWSEDLKAWFPEGKNDPNIMILKVDVDKGEYWDTPSGLLSRAYAYARAVVAGKKNDSDDVNEHAKVDVK